MLASALCVLFFCASATLRAETTSPFGGEFQAAQRDFRERKLDAALTALDRSKEASVQALDLRGCILLEKNDFDGAGQAFAAAHAAAPKLFAPRLHRGDALLRAGKFAEARGQYEALLKETNILISNERLRFAVLMTYLGEKDDASAKAALDRIKFPTESAAYFYAQAAWAFAHKQKREGEKWIGQAEQIFTPQETAWFAQPLFDRGWITKRPELVFPLAG
ncbi:MAG: hypothetical protein M3R59_03865 [Verrucomicrobiota bacterium]|nr:hypothetical protein [Verrucomicrobiota bacterium]